jgi:spore maturation protein CgeB
MRFFEIPAAGGLQVSSRCPEMEGEFRQHEQIVYYDDAKELPTLIDRLKSNEEFRARVAAAGHAHVMEKHTYRHRAETLLEHVAGVRD